MIEGLEAEAVAQLVAEESGGARERATHSHQGIVIEVRARRGKDGAAVLGYSYDGVRLERAMLLLLICPESECERSQAVKQHWQALKPAAPALQRRPRTAMKGAMNIGEARLFAEVSMDCAAGSFVARPASLKCFVACPVQAHRPAMIHKSGWDLFRDGKYVAGGVVRRADSGESTPRFPSVKDAARWLAHSYSAKRPGQGGCADE